MDWLNELPKESFDVDAIKAKFQSREQGEALEAIYKEIHQWCEDRATAEAALESDVEKRTAQQILEELIAQTSCLGIGEEIPNDIIGFLAENGLIASPDRSLHIGPTKRGLDFLAAVNPDLTSP